MADKNRFSQQVNDPDLEDRIRRRKRKKRRKKGSSILFALLIILCVVAIVFFAVLFIIRRADKPGSNSTQEPTGLWYESTSGVSFYSPTPSQTSSLTPTVPTATPTATLTPTRTMTSTPRLASPIPTDTAIPEEFLETYVPQLSGDYSDEWYEIYGKPGTVSAGLIYDNVECTWMGIAGIITDYLGNPLSGVRVQVGGFANGEVRETLSGLFPSYGESGYEITLARPVQEIEEMLWIQLVNTDGQPVSEQANFHPVNSCDNNLILINFQKTK